jgi:hypothetical protein
LPDLQNCIKVMYYASGVFRVAPSAPLVLAPRFNKTKNTPALKASY